MSLKDHISIVEDDCRYLDHVRYKGVLRLEEERIVPTVIGEPSETRQLVIRDIQMIILRKVYEDVFSKLDLMIKNNIQKSNASSYEEHKVRLEVAKELFSLDDTLLRGEL